MTLKISPSVSSTMHATVLLSTNQQTKIQVPSFTHSKYTIGEPKFKQVPTAADRSTWCGASCQPCCTQT